MNGVMFMSNKAQTQNEGAVTAVESLLSGEWVGNDCEFDNYSSDACLAEWLVSDHRWLKR